MPIPGTRLALTGAGTDHTNYTSKRRLCVNSIYQHVSESVFQLVSFRVRKSWLTSRLQSGVLTS
jgi:hypothetical protein